MIGKELICSRCNKIVNSYANKKSCRDCYNKYMSEYMLKRYHSNRIKIIQKLGSVCAMCGGDDRLEIDHVNAEDKSFSVSKLWSLSEKSMQKELDKCQLLCYTCHKEKTVKDVSNWMKNSEPRSCECGREFENHSKYSGHKAHCKT